MWVVITKMDMSLTKSCLAQSNEQRYFHILTKALECKCVCFFLLYMY